MFPNVMRIIFLRNFVVVFGKVAKTAVFPWATLSSKVYSAFSLASIFDAMLFTDPSLSTKSISILFRVNVSESGIMNKISRGFSLSFS